mmetsp:Transcript_138594/g.276325  ORF Transcript_138594/g.276325 Transcript_138594/m.276325 type:complete len:88 (-) Transcript_138594:1469-1732(-)
MVSTVDMALTQRLLYGQAREKASRLRCRFAPNVEVPLNRQAEEKAKQIVQLREPANMHPAGALSPQREPVMMHTVEVLSCRSVASVL